MASSAGWRVFLDTNVVFSGLYTERGPPGRILAAAVDGLFLPVLSSTVIEEVVRNLQGKLPRALPQLDLLFSLIHFEVAPEASEAVLAGLVYAGFGTDAPIIAAAIQAGVDYLCTGDRGFRERAATTGGISVTTPREMLTLLTRGSS